MSTSSDGKDDCRDSLWSLVPIVLTASSMLVLGFIVGRTSYRKDLSAAIRTVERSSVPVEVHIKEAF